LAKRKIKGVKLHCWLWMSINSMQINDTLGHACGDQVLCAVAKRLNALVEGAGLVALLGGDEFAILISRCRRVEQGENAV